jgi:glyoxylase-like metal-dependent hydrolase (beta-lactamase superfamily II)
MLTVTPLVLGMLTVDRSTLTFMRGFGEPVDVPILAWLLRDATRIWLVDTGAPSPDFVAARIGPMRQTPDQTLAACLDSHGIAPDDVDTVIVTHLHYDHIGGAALLRNARFVVQRAELAYATDPLPVHARGFLHPRAGFTPQPWREMRTELCDGDAQLSADVELLLTPGHTPGLQSVVVDTAEGRVVLASDNVPLAANWTGAPPLEPHIPSGVHVDVRACYASFERLERTRAAVYPGHDLTVVRA